MPRRSPTRSRSTPTSARRSTAYQAARLPPTAKLTLDNRRTGPERVLQMTEERCDGRCGDVHTCIPRDELAEIAQQYKRLAGFDKDALNALRGAGQR